MLRVRYGRHAFLLCGDVERQIEWAMLDAGETARADVLKVAHHGSRTSSTEEFLAAVAPTFAIVSAGFENSYGHPHPDVLDRLERHRAVVLRTDLDGLITIRSDGRRLAVGTSNGFLGALDIAPKRLGFRFPHPQVAVIARAGRRPASAADSRSR